MTTAVQDPGALQQRLDDFVRQAKAALGGELHSVILFGSAARSEPLPAASNANLLIVLKRGELDDFSKLAPVLKWGERKARITALLWSEDELKHSADVFPVEFLDILKEHRVLHGADPLADLRVDTKHLRHQVEYELRSKLLRLRADWPDVQSSAHLLSEYLGRAGTSLGHLFRHAQSVAQLDPALAEPFDACARLKRQETRLSRPELQDLYRRVHENLARVVQTIDAVGGGRT